MVLWHIAPWLVGKGYNGLHNALLGAVRVVLKVAAANGCVRGVQNLLENEQQLIGVATKTNYLALSQPSLFSAQVRR